MRSLSWKAGLAAAAFILWLPSEVPGQGAAQPVLLYSFENDAEGWRADWGCTEGGPDTTQVQAHHGKSSVVCHHKFGKGEESAAVAVTLDAAKDLRGKRLSAWVLLPEHTGTWQGQIYVRCGTDKNPVFAKLRDGLKAGWNQLTMGADEIPEPEAVEEIGVQLKNWNARRSHEFFVDQIEILPAE